LDLTKQEKRQKGMFLYTYINKWNTRTETRFLVNKRVFLGCRVTQ